MAPREVYGCAKLWERAGAEVRNFGVWPLGPQPAERGVFRHKKQVACGARETVTNPAQPMAPTVPTPPWVSPRAIPVAGLGLVPFWQLLFWPAGGYLRPRAKTMVFHAQGGTRGALVQKGAVLGPPTSTLDGPIGCLVEHNIFCDIFQKVH